MSFIIVFLSDPQYGLTYVVSLTPDPDRAHDSKDSSPASSIRQKKKRRHRKQSSKTHKGKQTNVYQNPTKGRVGFCWKKSCIFPLVTPFFLRQKIFFGFSEKISKCFFNEIDCKKFLNFFCIEFSSKKFFNEICCKKFSNFFYCWIHCKNNSKILYSQFHWKNISKFFYSQFHWKNISKFFQKIRKNVFCLKKKKGSQGAGGCSFFSSKIRHGLSLGFDIYLAKQPFIYTGI